MAIVTAMETEAGGPRRYRLQNPATLAPVGELRCADNDEVRDAIGRARTAQPAWAALSFEARGEYLRRALRVLVERQDHVVDVIVRESGKPRIEAIMIDVFAACDSLSYYSKHARKALEPERRHLHGVLRLAKKLEVHYRPLGVVGVIAPWNGPLILALNPAVQALMAGNTVLVKPSEVTPYSGQLVQELFDAAGLPSNVLQVVMGDGATGAALVEGGVDKIHFTGSVETGRRIAEACGRQLIPCTLELGGKDAMIVCADADLDNAAGGAVAGAMFNAGQYCCGTERVYVVDEVADEFTAKVVDRVAQLRQESSGEFDVGPIFWDRQLEKIQDQMDDALERGATVLAGGKRNAQLEGLFFEPTVLTDVDHDMRIMCEETFGPVLPIVRVRDVDEAVRLANDTKYGLSGNVWTSDIARGEAIAARLETGSVCINDMAMTYGAPEAPFGGRKESGIGQANGEVGLRGFCHAQPVLVDRFGGKQTANHYPYDAKMERMMTRMIKLLWGGKPRWVPSLGRRRV